MQFLKRGRTVNFGFISKGKTKSQIRTLLHFWVLCRLQRACSSLAVRERCNTLYLDYLPELCSSFQLHLSDHCTVFCTFQDHFILTRYSIFCLCRLWAGWTLLHAVSDCCQAPCCWLLSALPTCSCQHCPSPPVPHCVCSFPALWPLLQSSGREELCKMQRGCFRWSRTQLKRSEICCDHCCWQNCIREGSEPTWQYVFSTFIIDETDVHRSTRVNPCLDSTVHRARSSCEHL